MKKVCVSHLARVGHFMLILAYCLLDQPYETHYNLPFRYAPGEHIDAELQL